MYIADSKQNLMIVEKIIDKLDSTPPSSPTHKPRDECPDTNLDQCLPTISVRIIINCNGMQVPSAKMIKVNFNDTYDNFYQAIIPKLYSKTGEAYDLMTFDRKLVTLKYALITNTRAISLSKKPLQLHEYCDLNDDSDYEALQLKMRRLHEVSQNQRRRSNDGLNNRSLQFHATLVKPNRGQLSESNSSGGSNGRTTNVSFMLWTFC